MIPRASLSRTEDTFEVEAVVEAVEVRPARRRTGLEEHYKDGIPRQGETLLEIRR